MHKFKVYMQGDHHRTWTIVHAASSGAAQQQAIEQSRKAYPRVKVWTVTEIRAI